MYSSNLKSKRCFFILDNIAIHSLEHVGRGDHFIFHLAVE